MATFIYKKLTGKSIVEWAREQGLSREAVRQRFTRLQQLPDRDEIFAQMRTTGIDPTYRGEDSLKHSRQAKHSIANSTIYQNAVKRRKLSKIPAKTQYHRDYIEHLADRQDRIYTAK